MAIRAESAAMRCVRRLAAVLPACSPLLASAQGRYRKQLRMLARVPFLRSIATWGLMAFRSPVRMHPIQTGYNRKGLLSERGERKLARQAFHDHYAEVGP